MAHEALELLEDICEYSMFFLCACEGQDHSNVIVLDVAWFGLHVYEPEVFRIDMTILER